MMKNKSKDTRNGETLNHFIHVEQAGEYLPFLPLHVEALWSIQPEVLVVIESQSGWRLTTSCLVEYQVPFVSVRLS